MRILLVEAISETAQRQFIAAGHTVTALTSSPNHDELSVLLAQHDVVCVRSRCKLPGHLLRIHSHLLAVGCYCIGTDQVDIKVAGELGVAVFNSPFANTRSVAELILGQIIALARHLGDQNRHMHAGMWTKTATASHQIKGKTLGIIGYGHIGSQVSVLAEAVGMRVIFTDVVPKMGYGQAECMSRDDVLAQADFVTLHVPLNATTFNMMNADTLAQMKEGACLLNASRGPVVDMVAVAAALKSGQLGGLYLDVYPHEPEKNGQMDGSVYQPVFDVAAHTNVILSPHIGGSTEEAQEAIAEDVTGKLLRYLAQADSSTCVNLPQICERVTTGLRRLVYIQTDRIKVSRVPGLILASDKIKNIRKVCYALTEDVHYYYILDVDGGCEDVEGNDGSGVDCKVDAAVDIQERLTLLPSTVKCFVCA